MVNHSLRILGLVTDAFGGYGGIAQYNRDFFCALSNCEDVSNVIVLPRATANSATNLPSKIQQLPPVRGRLAYSCAALQLATRYQPIDIVFCGHLFMAPLALITAKLLDAALWIQVHGTDAWQEFSALHRWSLRSATLVTSVSRYTRRRLLEWAGVEPWRVRILPATVDPRFHPGSKPSYLIERHATHGKKVLLTVSRLAASEQQKGQDRVIRVLPRVLSEHPDTVYLIVGEGDDRARLESLIIQFGVEENVQFVGMANPEELPDYFRLADVYVMPSTQEGFGIAFLEAIASGIHVIGGNADGSLDPLGDGLLGTAIDPANCNELASAICASIHAAPAIEDRSTRFKVQPYREHLEALVRWTAEYQRR